MSLRIHGELYRNGLTGGNSHLLGKSGERFGTLVIGPGIGLQGNRSGNRLV